MRPLTACSMLLLLTCGICAGQEKKEAVAKVTFADLSRDPAKFAGRTVVIEGVVEETPQGKGRNATLWLERTDMPIVCEGKPDVMAGDKVRVTAICEVSGTPAKLRLVSASVEKIIQPVIAGHLTVPDLLKDPKKYHGKLIELDGALRDTPEAIEFMGEFRYSPRLSAGLQITLHGKPMNLVKGEWVRITGTVTVEEGTFSPIILEATNIEKLPPRPGEIKPGPMNPWGGRPRFPRRLPDMPPGE